MYRMNCDFTRATASDIGYLPKGGVIKFTTMDTHCCGGTHRIAYKADWECNTVMVYDGKESFPMTVSQLEYLRHIACVGEDEVMTPEGDMFAVRLC